MGGAGALPGRAVLRRHGDASAISRPHRVCVTVPARQLVLDFRPPFGSSPLPTRSVSDGASNTPATRVSRPRHPRRLPACNATLGASLPRNASATAGIHIFSGVRIDVPLREPPLITSSPPTSARPLGNSLSSRRSSKLEMNHPQVDTVEIPISYPPPTPAGASGGGGARETGRASDPRPPSARQQGTRGELSPAARGRPPAVGRPTVLRGRRPFLRPPRSSGWSAAASRAPLRGTQRVRRPTRQAATLRGTPPAAPLQAPFRAGGCAGGGWWGVVGRCRGASRRWLAAPVEDAP